MHRHAVNRLLSSLARTQPAVRQCTLVLTRCLATQGEPKATPALLDKLRDKDLLKVHGFIGGQWVSASDGTVMEVQFSQRCRHSTADVPCCPFCKTASS